MKRLPLVLVPGLACDRDVWSHQIKHLADVADPIIIPDLSMCDTAEKMRNAVIEAAPEKFWLAGHSMGGWVALEVMEHFGDRVEKLCLLSTTAEVDTEKKRHSRKALLKVVENGNYDDVVEDLLDLFVFREQVRAPVREMLLRNERAFVNQQKALLERESLVAALGKISQPTLLILGRDDIDFPRETQDIARAVPAGKLAWIENCGHMSPMEQPEAVTALMRFWIEHME